MGDDEEERRLILEYSDAAMNYSTAAQQLDHARRFLPKYEYLRIQREFEAARIRCEEARQALQAYRAGKP